VWTCNGPAHICTWGVHYQVGRMSREGGVAQHQLEPRLEVFTAPCSLPPSVALARKRVQLASERRFRARKPGCHASRDTFAHAKGGRRGKVCLAFRPAGSGRLYSQGVSPHDGVLGDPIHDPGQTTTLFVSLPMAPRPCR
jgi:hypothetical protein